MFSQMFKKADFEVRIISKRSEIMRVWNSEEEAGRKEYYYERDDHVSIRRASFRPGRNRIGIHRNRNLDKAAHAYIEDDDVDMSTPGSGGSCRRFNPYSWRSHYQAGGYGGGKRRSSQGGPAERRREFSDTSSFFYKVTIPHGGKYSKDYILQMLLDSIAPAVFVPLGYEVRGKDSSFYVDDSQAAEKLALVNKKVTTIEGYKLLVKVRPGLPHVEFDSDLKQKLKAAMEKRYNRNLKALDLSRFHADPDLAGNHVVALVRPNVILAVLDVIVENVPELAALDLSDNKLYSLDSLSVLSLKVPNLRALHIGKNRIQDMHELDCLEGLRLEELVLNGNPLCKKYEDKTVYMSEVRKRFPKVLKLDGADLQTTSKENYMCADEGMAVVHRFLQQYYQLYDSDKREELIVAYHDSAMLSVTSTYPEGQRSTATSELVSYTADNVHHMSVEDTNREQKLFCQGKVAIVAYLCKLPRTQHDQHSFCVDLALCTPQMIVMSVSGIFRELGPTDSQFLRSFKSQFVIVPVGEGLCIISEQLFVTDTTDEQNKVAFATPRPMLLPLPTPAAVHVPVAATPLAAPIDDNVKMQMVEAFAAQSGMNVTYARKCLDENNWNVEEATYVFNTLNEQEKIPVEAFVK